MFEVNATRKTFAGHKFYSETVLDEFCEAVLISSILYLKYQYLDERLRDGTYRRTVRMVRTNGSSKGSDSLVQTVNFSKHYLLEKMQ